MLVGTLTTGGTTLNPCGGATGTFLGNCGTLTTFGVGALGLGASLGGGGSFLGGGGTSFFTDTKLTFVCTSSFFRVPARAVAKIARKMINECNIMLKMVPPADRPFFSRLDSSSCIAMEG